MRLKPEYLVTIILGFFVVSAMLFGFSQVVGEGINSEFAFRLAVACLVGVFAFVLVFGFLPNLRENFRIRVHKFRLDAKVIILSFIPLVPIVGYLYRNSDLLSIPDVISLVVFFAAVNFIFVSLIPSVIDLAGQRQKLSASIASLLFVLWSMAGFAEIFAWSGVGNFPTQATLLAFVGLVVFLMISLGVRTLSVLILFLIVSQIFTGQGQLIANEPNQANDVKLDEGLTSEIFSGIGLLEEKPDIFIIVYESYPSPETLSRYGLDSSGHIDFLEKSGFKVFDDIWTVSGASLTSISRVFSPANVEPGFKETRGIVSGSSAYWDLFRSAGYDSASIAASDYFYRGLVPSHDYFYPELGSIASPLAQGILEGEFRFELSWAPSPYETYLQEKRAFLSGGSSQPSVLYTHNKYPGHSQNSGECQPEDKTDFVRGLELANDEMVLDVAAIGSKLKDSIVVIAGDHGPYLTLNCTDLGDFDEGQIDKFAIQDRLSTFLAVSFPEGYQDYPKPKILQDIIPMILSVLSGGGENMFDGLRRAADSTPGQFNGVSVIGGLIQGGPDNGEPLFDLD